MTKQLFYKFFFPRMLPFPGIRVVTILIFYFVLFSGHLRLQLQPAGKYHIYGTGRSSETSTRIRG